jgi:hypothetical protein
VLVTGYRLRPVQQQRERDEKSVRGELADAVGDASEAARRLAEASQRVASVREAIRHSASSSPTTIDRRLEPARAIAELVRVERYRARLRGQLELALVDELRARDACDGKTASVDLARDRLAVARAARRVVETHFARWRDDQRKLAERRED